MPPLAATPLVSIVVPSFNQGGFIRETLESIRQQDHPRLQVFVMDGASKDETVDVLRALSDWPALEWTSEPDEGVVDAVNKGLRRVQGDIVGIQSSDDVYLPGCLRQVVGAFQRELGVGLVYGESEYIDARSRKTGETRCGDNSLQVFLSRRTFIMQNAAFFRRELLAVLGGWRAAYSLRGR